MNFSAVKSKLKNILAVRRDYDASKAEFNPYHDWNIIVLLFAVLLAGTIVFCTYVFFTIEKETPAATDPVAASTGLDRKGLEDAIILYEKKTKDFNALFNSRTEVYAEVPDPSR